MSKVARPLEKAVKSASNEQEMFNHEEMPNIESLSFNFVLNHTY